MLKPGQNKTNMGISPRQQQKSLATIPFCKTLISLVVEEKEEISYTNWRHVYSTDTLTTVQHSH